MACVRRTTRRGAAQTAPFPSTLLAIALAALAAHHLSLTPASTTVAAVALPSSSNATASTSYASKIRLNQIQLVGVHNTYHVQPEQKLMDLALKVSPDFQGWQYTHKPIPKLLAAGVRSFELDVYYDPKGGLYYNHDANRLIQKPVASGQPQLLRPGYKVLHVQDMDFRTTCLTFVTCLRQLYAWSLKHPSHLPITVKVEPKDDSIRQMAGDTAAAILRNAAVPLPVTAASLAALEREVLSVIPRARIVKPDDVRGRYPTLLGAIKARGWPTLKQAAGKFLFVMVNDKAIDIYRAGAPQLQRKLFFTGSGAVGRADAAVVSLEGVTGEGIAAQQQLGGIVWARADSDTKAARENDIVTRTLVLFGGVQIVHTDYPAAEAPNPFGTPYYVALPGNKKARCNPVTAPKWCRDWMVAAEPLV
eukprot:TRINITY_DN23578_c0_g2_i1.p1 TRINITY_DN23578_c0_g2~~TRINITY_DN23578_c0_g2_i1.p1  ORF type:complete len:419 (+),score=15.89 TRINITY_DN23578_c0_g2_i1:208-1464(+)